MAVLQPGSLRRLKWSLRTLALALLLGAAGCSAGDGTDGLIAFAAGGSIYTVRPDGSSLREVVPGSHASDETWASAPALSPLGRSIVFVRGFNLWAVRAGGEDLRLLADVADIRPSPGASNWSLGAQWVAWSPDGRHIAYGTARIHGSGVSRLWVMDSDGGNRREIEDFTANGTVVQWFDDRQLLIPEMRGPDFGALRILTVIGEPDPPDAPIEPIELLASSFGSQRPITFARDFPDGPGEIVGNGVAAALSPDGEWFAYISGETLLVRSIDEETTREIVDLAALGGRDHYAGSGCGGVTACSYRAPSISWVALR